MRRTRRVRALLLAASFIGSAGVLGTPHVVLARSAHPTEGWSRLTTPAIRCADVAAAPFSMFIPLSHARFFGSVELMLNNRGVVSHEVSPTWYVTNHGAVRGETFTIPEGHIEFADVRRLLPPGVDFTDVDGLELAYVGKKREVWSQALLRPLGAAQPTQNIDDSFSMSTDFVSSRLVAVWGASGQDEHTVVAIANTSDGSINVDVTDASGTQRVHLTPHSGQAVGLSGRQAAGSHSVLLESDGPPAALRATGFVLNATDGLPHVIRFSDPDGGISGDLFATGLPVQHVTLAVALQSLAANPLVVSADFLDETTGDPIASSTVMTIPAHSNRRLDLGDLPRFPKNVVSVGVRINNSGAPGTLIGDLHAVDSLSGLGYDVPLRDIGPLRRSTGGYPWRLDGDYETRMSITNVGDGPALFVARLHYDGGDYVFRTRRLPMGASATFDLRQLRDTQIPDIHGHTIPTNVKRGQFYWTKLDGGTDMHLIGRAQVVSIAQHVCSSYSCDIECPDSFVSADQPSDMVVNIGNSADQSVSETMEAQYGGDYDIAVDPSEITWSTNDAAIATGQSDSDTVSGNGTGTTELQAAWGAMEYDEDANSDGTGDCDPQSTQGEASFSVEVLGPSGLRQRQ